MPEKSLAEKLMIKEGRSVWLVNPPEGYERQLGKLPSGATLSVVPGHPVDIIQVFVKDRKDLEAQLGELKHWMKPKGMLWVTYHKGTSKVKTDINRDSIVEYARSIGMEGVAMVSIDEDWSALRLKAM